MGSSMQGLVGSIKEGTQALTQSIGHAVKGDWEEAGKDFARVGLEAAGAAGTVFLGPGAEVAQEAIEGALDNAVLERPTGDVAGPGGGADWSVDNLLAGAVEGGAESAMGVFGGMSGGSSSLQNVMGAVGGSGGGGGSLEQLLGGALGGGSGGSGSVEALAGSLSNAGDAAGLMGNLQSEAGYVRGRVVSSTV
jgi:hypothetical protein